ncbi:hypothetical protein C8F04DRAFT_1242995 [Mycena alexandri]|uniref:Uncharacterized protein n=1 Tax=Mycena alexandri TaxID=1745969 RepID=A0AAD6S1Y3_9AGAR|nr:hypothetical protein C8F04DRAFT_1242995 [Mycena alexandri]
MPLFKRSNSSEPILVTPPATPPTPRQGGFFSRRTDRPPSPDPTGASSYRSATSKPNSDTASVRSSFFFGRRRSADSVSLAPSARTTGTHASHASRASNASAASTASVKSQGKTPSMFSTTLKRYAARTRETDPTVVAARQKVASAAEAEAEADRAVLHARARVRDAMESIKVLEEEAQAEANRAKAKNVVARLVSKDARGLGRHGQA